MTVRSINQLIFKLKIIDLPVNQLYHYKIRINSKSENQNTSQDTFSQDSERVKLATLLNFCSGKLYIGQIEEV